MSKPEEPGPPWGPCGPGMMPPLRCLPPSPQVWYAYGTQYGLTNLLPWTPLADLSCLASENAECLGCCAVPAIERASYPVVYAGVRVQDAVGHSVEVFTAGQRRDLTPPRTGMPRRVEACSKCHFGVCLNWFYSVD